MVVVEHARAAPAAPATGRDEQHALWFGSLILFRNRYTKAPVRPSPSHCALSNRAPHVVINLCGQYKNYHFYFSKCLCYIFSHGCCKGIKFSNFRRKLEVFLVELAKPLAGRGHCTHRSIDVSNWYRPIIIRIVCMGIDIDGLVHILGHRAEVA